MLGTEQVLGQSLAVTVWLMSHSHPTLGPGLGLPLTLPPAFSFKLLLACQHSKAILYANEKFYKENKGEEDFKNVSSTKSVRM